MFLNKLRQGSKVSLRLGECDMMHNVCMTSIRRWAFCGGRLNRGRRK